METADIAVLATVMAALSVAAERLVDIVKGLVPYLETAKDDAGKEGRRRVVLHVLAVLAGIVTVLLADESLAVVLPKSLVKAMFEGGEVTVWGAIALGLLSSGGSGLWNSVLGYANKVKDIKKLQAEEVRKRLS